MCGVQVRLHANTGGLALVNITVSKRKWYGNRILPRDYLGLGNDILNGGPKCRAKPGEISPFILLFIRSIRPLCNSIG